MKEQQGQNAHNDGRVERVSRCWSLYLPGIQPHDPECRAEALQHVRALQKDRDKRVRVIGDDGAECLEHRHAQLELQTNHRKRRRRPIPLFAGGLGHGVIGTRSSNP